ncbi:unnamed protein product [Prunus armeniaca]|uniref:FLZ-type domain-containing protein n=1 Tax=Prunus armeniaca TaxID=36596 RepID=A0A6J5U751_PRUAR|nr:unnamed protein product [Prunus armeniaca]
MNSKFRKGSNLVDHKQSSVAVGLKILIQVSQGNKSNIIVKSSLRLSQPNPEFSCFLKTCHLCNKGLSLEKEVYMYRGDLGFCSIQCRNRQIVIDEMRDLEASTKQMLASYRRGQNRCSSNTRVGLVSWKMQQPLALDIFIDINVLVYVQLCPVPD